MRILLAFAACVGLLSGCGASTLQQFVAESPAGYPARCQKSAADHDRALRELEYLQPGFRTLVWTGEAAPNADGVLTEDKLMRELREGVLKSVFVQARGGIGKTEFGKAVFAEICSAQPTFTIDFKDIAKAGGTQAAITAAMRATLQAPEDKDAAFKELLASARFTLVIDSLDEVAPAQRTASLQALGEMRKQYPTMQLLMLGRPSIHDQYYGMQDLDAVLEISPLDCSRARSALLHTAADKPERERMTAFVSTWRLDRQAVFGQQCYYPFLSTYRDLQAIKRLSAAFDAPRDRGGQQHSLAEIHEAILVERIRKELSELKMAPEEALAAVDKMLQLDGYNGTEWNLGFSVERCLKAEGGPSARNDHLCEELFQSVMFERIGGNKGAVKGAEWKFGFQAIADLFVARWLEAQLTKAGTCKPIEEQAKMFPGKEVAGYLVGRPQGQKCLATVVQAACGEGATPEDLLVQVKRGLPAVPAAREAAVTAAKTALQSAKPANACIDAVMQKL
ncbi:MAG: hypothetical protein HY902_16485 [Deltaproteobacteria bacterium]|nr:hypothetical protein [Deltaproteobacteria bacterium]